jgi:hypothetical protein
MTRDAVALGLTTFTELCMGVHWEIKAWVEAMEDDDDGAACFTKCIFISLHQ